MPDTTSRVRVLHVEDSLRDAEIIRGMLEADSPTYDVVHVANRSRFESALAEGAFDVIICDFNLPDLDGLTALRLTRDRFPNLPVLIVSGAIDPAEAVECLKNGATDYLFKQRLERLPSAVTRAIEEAENKRRREVIEANLRESEERFRQLAEHSGEGFWFVALNPERILYVSPAVETIWGLSADRFYQDSRVWLEAVHADDRARMQKAWEAWAKGLAPRFGEECRVVRPDGSVRWVLTSGTQIRDEDGDITRLSGLTRDITERKQLEHALRASEEQYRQLVEGASEVFYKVTTPDDPLKRRLEFVSQRALNVTGRHPEEFIRDRELWVKSVHPNDLPALAESTHAALAGRKSVTRAYRIQHIDGIYRSIEDEITPVVDAQGNAIGYTGVARDVSERRRLEAQLQQSQKMESVGQLAGGIAHDFNNLLTVINGMSDLVLSQLHQDDPVRGDVQEIRAAGERAATLTRQLLAFSRQQILEPRVLNINTAVVGMESLLQRLLGEDIDLVVVPAADLDSVKADPGQIEQVISNLAVNARDAMPQGGTLTIETQNVTIDEDFARRHGVAMSRGSYVLLAVTDSGVGMDEGTRAHIFEPFYTTKGLGKGTGLGLSTVYGIVKQSQGFISVYSEVGHGTIFKMYLPRVTEAATIDQPEPTVVSRPGTETVLLVEDNAGLRRLATRFLEPAGYTVLGAARGEEALRLLAGHGGPVHLLLSDVVMPDMSGRQIAERLAKTHPSIKVLYMSGYTSDTVVRHGVLDAQMPFLSKPFTAAALLRKVREVLDS